MDANLARWIFSSIAVYFAGVASTLSETLFVEGIDERQESTMNSEHSELRINGPFVAEVSKDYWKIHVDINILTTDYMSMGAESAYNIDTIGGGFLAAMSTVIPIYKHGGEVGDDGSFVGCLKARKNISDPIRLLRFGQIHKTDRIRQCEVDGRFEMFLDM